MSYKKIAIWLWNASKGERSTIALSSIVSVLRVGCMLWFVYASKRVIDIATAKVDGDIFVAAMLMGAAISSEILLGIAGGYLEKIMEVKVQNRLRYRLFGNLMNAEWSGIEKHHSGDVMSRLVQDVNDVAVWLTSSISRLFSSGFQLVASFVFLYFLDKRLALVMVCIMPVFILISKAYLRRMRSIVLNIRKSDSKIQSVMQESVQRRVVIKTLEQSDAMLEQLYSMQFMLREQVREKTRFSSFSKGMISGGFATGYFTAFVWGALKLSTGSISFGVMTAFLQLVGQVQRPTVELTQLIPTLISALAASERLMELEALPQEADVEPIAINGSIGVRLTNVDFSYNGRDSKILNNFSFDFKPGTTTAILGETGAGKTTIIRLLLALTKPQHGSVSVYGKEGSCTASAATRGNFIYVPQGNTLFSGTIRDNLKLGNPEASEQEMMDALTAAAADFVTTLPNGLDTYCGEQGGGISEGQAQRIAIARSFLRPGSIILLDEATSALDPQTESLLLNRLKTFKGDKTVIFITHRMALVEQCDSVLKLD